MDDWQTVLDKNYLNPVHLKNGKHAIVAVRDGLGLPTDYFRIFVFSDYVYFRNCIVDVDCQITEQWRRQYTLRTPGIR